jgi:hypothetical protein
VTSNGECCTTPVDAANRSVCPLPRKLIVTPPPVPACAAGYALVSDGSCCLERHLSADRKRCLGTPTVCPAGTARAHGKCILAAPPRAACPPGVHRLRSGRCGSPATAACPEGTERVHGKCIAAPPPQPACPPGSRRLRSGGCAPPARIECPDGTLANRRGRCVLPPSPACGPGFVRGPRGFCRPLGALRCPPGFFRNRFGLCVPLPGPGFAPRRGFFPGGGFRPGPGLPGGGVLR